MHESHGADVSNLDDASSHYGLSHSYRNRPPKLRAGEMPENNVIVTDAKGRRRMTLPETDGTCDPELYGKSPDEIAEILESRARAEEESVNTEAIMRQYPGKPADGAPHSSSGGRSIPKPKPPPDFVNAGGRGGKEDPEKFRPWTVAGRVSSAARSALEAQKPRGASVGEILELLGETLHRGVTWAQIEWTLRDLMEKRRAS